MSKDAHFSHDELARLLEARDWRDAIRFGLVWETNEIGRNKAINFDFVALNLASELSAGASPWENLIIEGGKSLCHDVCARRARCVIEGYGDTAATSRICAPAASRLGSFSKSSTRKSGTRSNSSTLARSLPTTPSPASSGRMTSTKPLALAYVPRFTEKLLPALLAAIKTTDAVTILIAAGTPPPARPLPTRQPRSHP
jgi:hypothetical protein